MKKICFIFLLIAVTQGNYAQVLIEDGKSAIEVKKAKKNGKWEVTTSRYTISAGKNSKKVQIRVKLASQTGEKVIIDPNKFYLVVDNYKIRVRPVDLKYPFALASIAFVRLIKEDEYGSGNTARGGYNKNDEVVDTFKDYAIPGYLDIETTLNFGSENKPRIKTIYYQPNDIENSLVDIYFMLPKDVMQFSFYYGDILVEKILID
ncbi:hypothetical protein ATE92_2728 [Ulvibacter sp. MAR_2010_11]|uniref:hypothetical protein n=1 Tax=Ulvibacter sp. MAR_2010_11 TaxID=1250229 RepID=UPI000C2BCE42|nr:hypothetical protein [Ulvibacter sp. MAR_2010_11]PKA84532.1 hypothetical protein ATE92_2728 [Ulvibacter sp. MAR_2010_11]